jgi:hypothetical protein
VEEVIGKGAYRLKLPPHMRAHNVFNIVSLKAFRTDGRYQETPPVLVDGEEEFVIEKISAHRKKGRSLEYQVRWLGYGPEHNTWEPQRNLHDTEAFGKYWDSLGLEPPVHANTRQAVKARTAKVVFEEQHGTFRRTLTQGYRKRAILSARLAVPKQSAQY